MSAENFIALISQQHHVLIRAARHPKGLAVSYAVSSLGRASWRRMCGRLCDLALLRAVVVDGKVDRDHFEVTDAGRAHVEKAGWERALALEAIEGEPR